MFGRFTKKIIRFAFSGLYQFLPTIAGFALSLTISRTVDIGLWGEFAAVVLLMNLMLAFTGYGSKDYVVHRSAASPATQDQIWATDFTSRVVLIVPAVIFLMLLNYPLPLRLILCAWLLMGYVHKSFESKIALDRSFAFSVWIDGVFYLLLISAVLIFRTVGLTELCLSQVLLFSVRSFFLIFRYRILFLQNNFRFQWKHFSLALFFFLPQFVGFAGSRAEQYVSLPLLSSTEFAGYQLLMGFILLFQGGVAAVIAPYTKIVIRMKVSRLANLNIRLVLLGGVCCAVYLTGIGWLLRVGYGAEVSVLMLTLALLPGVLYLSYALLYSKVFTVHPRYITGMHTLAILINLSVSGLLIPIYGAVGALIANIASQMVNAGMLWWKIRKEFRA